jgi:hypothetical protein
VLHVRPHLRMPGGNDVESGHVNSQSSVAMQELADGIAFWRSRPRWPADLNNAEYEEWARENPNGNFTLESGSGGSILASLPCRLILSADYACAMTYSPFESAPCCRSPAVRTRGSRSPSDEGMRCT